MDELTFALLSALLLAIGDSGKKFIAGRSSAYEAAFIVCAAGAVWLALPASIELAGLEGVDPASIAVPYLAALAILSVTELLFTEGIRSGDLSVSLPFLAFIPVFAAFAGYIFLGETMSITAAAGVLLVIVGAWTMFTSPGRSAVRAALAHRPTQLILGAALLAGIGSVPYKLGSTALSPVLFYWLVLAGESLVLYAACRAVGRQPFAAFRAMPMRVSAIALVWAAGMACYFVALEGALVAYAASVQRVHGLFGVLIGWRFFGEREVGKRLVAGAIMLAGVALVMSAN